MSGSAVTLTESPLEMSFLDTISKSPKTWKSDSVRAVLRYCINRTTLRTMQEPLRFGYITSKSIKSELRNLLEIETIACSLAISRSEASYFLSDAEVSCGMFSEKQI